MDTSCSTTGPLALSHAGAVAVIGRQCAGRPQPLLFVSLGRLLHNGPEALSQFILVSQQGIPENAHFLGFGVQQPPVEVLHLVGVHRQQGQAGVQLLARVVLRLCLGVVPLQQGIGPAAIVLHLLDDAGHLGHVRIEELANQPGGTGGLVFLDDPATNTQPGQRDRHQQYGEDHATNRMIPGRLAPSSSAAAAVQFFLRVNRRMLTTPTSGQLAVLRLGVPHRRPLRQPQFGPAAPGFLLLAGQPFPQ